MPDHKHTEREKERERERGTNNPGMIRLEQRWQIRSFS